METIRPGKYKHFKGNEYQVLCAAGHSETLEEVVVYKACYGNQEVWVRPAYMWNDIVTRDGMEKIPFDVKSKVPEEQF